MPLHEALTAALLILVPIVFNVAFFSLARAFDYPDILRRPTDEILRRFHAGGTALILRWELLLLSAIAMLPLVAIVAMAHVGSPNVFFDGDAGPYIIVQLDQLEAVRSVLDDAGRPYSVEEDAISLDGAPMTAVIDLGRRADVEDIQKRLDEATDPRQERPGGRRNARRG